uniref:Uncharacterized protein n=1 Tax=Rhizophora mucronata TaxID=61149 RepID=A0A2P2NP59_RHIMU
MFSRSSLEIRVYANEAHVSTFFLHAIRKEGPTM